MKKIMFNDKYGLTQAVLEKRKTMTRRIVPQSVLDHYLHNAEDPTIIDAARYEVGDVVAVAQSYMEVEKGGYPVDSRYEPFRYAYSVGLITEKNKGWRNKMFVGADYMPHVILITDVRVERLQDISVKDCLREGILKKSDFPYKKTSPFYFSGGKHEWDYSFHTPRQAYAALIDKVSGKGTWKRNPWVFVYEFELIN